MRIGPVLAILIWASSTGVSGCSDDGTSPTAVDPSATAGSTSPRDRASEPPASESADVPLVVTITVQGETLTPQAKQLELQVGDPLTLNIASDRAGELHVHSAPEQTLSFPPGKSTLRLTIDRPGQVDVEEHESGELLLRLLVQ